MVHMRLVVFDIDGTLTDTMEIDATPFIRTGAGVRAKRLAAEGAVAVLGDFSDSDLFLNHSEGITPSI
jgi:phosphoglycolate phosphatase-like HAD superfamily hydrolase